MSYEINIISVGQTKLSSSYHPTQFHLINEYENEEIFRYYRIWPVFSYTAGILYSLVKEVDGWISSFPLCDADFGAFVSPDLIPQFLSEEAKDNLDPLIIYPQYYSEVEKCIRMLIHDSPQKTILFLSRYEGGDYEIFAGALTISQFLQRLRKREILFNICYIVIEDLELQ